MTKVRNIEILKNYNIKIEFNDGFKSIINFKPYIGKGISKPLLNKNYFKKVKKESGGGITWPNGYDFCPDFLRQISKNNKIIN